MFKEVFIYQTELNSTSVPILCNLFNVCTQAQTTSASLSEFKLDHIKHESSCEPPMLALSAVNAAPTVLPILDDRLELLSPINAAPSVASTSPAACTESSPSIAAVSAQPGCALTSANPAGTSATPYEPNAAASRVPRHRAAQQAAAGSPTLHTLRLPDMTSNVTLATKDAFACVNAMFSSSLCHEPSRKPVSMAEPTVTISTKAAFDELNQMFSSDLPHHRQAAGSKQQRMLQPSIPRRPIGKKLASQKAADTEAGFGKAAHACTATKVVVSDSVPVAAESTGLLGLYEDTRFSPKAAGGGVPADQDMQQFVIFEDTNFFDGQSAGQEAASPAEANYKLGGAASLKHSMPSRPGDETVGFQIYEDTQCLGQKPDLQPTCNADDGMSPGGLGIYEDTQFVSKAERGPAKQSEPALSPGGFCIREDTQFVDRADVTGVEGEAATVVSPCGLGVYEDTQFVNKGDLRDTKLTSEAAAIEHANGPEEPEDKENHIGHARYVARSLAC